MTASNRVASHLIQANALLYSAEMLDMGNEDVFDAHTQNLIHEAREKLSQAIMSVSQHKPHAERPGDAAKSHEPLRRQA